MFCVFWRLGVAIEVPGHGIDDFDFRIETRGDGCVFCPARFIETLGARRGTRYPFRGVQEGRRTRPETREPGEEPGRTAWKLESAGPATVQLGGSPFAFSYAVASTLRRGRPAMSFKFAMGLSRPSKPPLRYPQWCESVCECLSCSGFPNRGGATRQRT